MKKLLVRSTMSMLLMAVFVGLSGCGEDTSKTPVSSDKNLASAPEKAVDSAAPSVTVDDKSATKTTVVDKDIVTIYQRSCISCHLSGAVNAPKSHDAAAWAPKLAKGMDVLIASINNGLNAMPPKGMCFDCTDDQYKALIEYMAGPKPD